MKKLLTLTLLAASLAVAQTTYTLDANGDCQDPNSSSCYQIYIGTTPMYWVAPMPEPIFYPQVSSVFTTGLSVPRTFHTGNIHPMPAPQSGVGQGTFNWSDGGQRSGSFTVNLYCSFDMFGAWPFYAVTCNGSTPDGSSSVTFTHILFLSEGRYGIWSWFDHHGTMSLTVN